MASYPERSWRSTELAVVLQITPHSMRTQLAEWVRHRLLTRTSRGCYTPDTPAASSTRSPER